MKRLVRRLFGAPVDIELRRVMAKLERLQPTWDYEYHRPSSGGGVRQNNPAWEEVSFLQETEHGGVKGRITPSIASKVGSHEVVTPGYYEVEVELRPSVRTPSQAEPISLIKRQISRSEPGEYAIVQRYFIAAKDQALKRKRIEDEPRRRAAEERSRRAEEEKKAREIALQRQKDAFLDS